jgi:hypothetical protein
MNEFSNKPLSPEMKRSPMGTLFRSMGGSFAGDFEGRFKESSGSGELRNRGLQ